MSNRLLKFARRKAAWEDAASAKISIDELQKTEFKKRDGGPDLEPSVYSIEPDHSLAVQAYAEHVAAVPIDPPKATIALDAVGLCLEVRLTPGNPKFEFIRDRHCELIIKSIAELHVLIQSIIRDFAARREGLTKVEVVEYAKGRICAGDRAWITVATSPEGQEKEWLKRLVAAENGS